jgi:hypothetical protein
MRADRQQKDMIITNILKGSIWTEESGLYQNTRTALTKLARVDLVNLMLIVNDKIANATRNTTK